MELFRQLNNEALDEDNKIQRQVIERLKKQVELFNQPYKKAVELNDATINNIEKYIINFDDTLNKSLNDVYKKGEEKEDTGDLILNYNLLANYLDKVNFNQADTNDKRDVIQLLDELTNKLGKILSVIKLKNYTDADLVEKVFNNFKNRTYNVVLEKERSITEKGLTEKEKKALEGTEGTEGTEEKTGEIVDIVAKIKQRLDTLIKKCENILIEKPKGNRKFQTIMNQAKTYLQLYNIGENPNLREVVMFLNNKEKVVEEYLNKEKSLLETTIGEPEAPEETLKLTPALQQGAEEPKLELPNEYQQEQENLFGDIEGSGKRKVYKKKLLKRK